MATQHIYLKDLHFDNLSWMNELRFYKEEISLMERRLEDIVTRNTDKDALVQVERFQNQYIREREVLDILFHDIKIAEEKLSQTAQDNYTAIDHQYFDHQADEHGKLRERFDTFKRIYAELKTDFLKFLSKWM